MAEKYAAGQIWQYKTRAGEEASTVLINKIEFEDTFGDIYHISVNGLKIPNPLSPGGYLSDLPHFPVSQVSLDISVTELVGQAEPGVEFEAGYQHWKEAFDEGSAGVFVLSIAEVVMVVEQNLLEED